MSIAETKLSHILQQRTEYVNRKTQLTVRNLVHAELKNAHKIEMPSFETLWKKSPNAYTSTGKPFKDVREFHIKKSDLIKTNKEISKEMEMLEMANLASEHDGFISLQKMFHQMVRNIFST